MNITEQNKILADLKQNNLSKNLTFNEIVKHKNNIKYVFYNCEELLTVDEYYKRKKNDKLFFNNHHEKVFLNNCDNGLGCIISTLLGLLLGLLLGYIFFKCDDKTVVEKQKTEVIDNYKNGIFETLHLKVALENGKESEFKIAVVSQEFKWKLGNSEFLENGNSVESIKPFIEENEDFKMAKALISVGTASQEGNTVTEELRASYRSESINKIIRSINTLSSPSLYTLNLGKHSNELTSSDTANQRRIIIISVLTFSNDITTSEMQELLKIALSKTDGLLFEYQKYTKFELQYQNTSSPNLFLP